MKDRFTNPAQNLDMLPPAQNMQTSWQHQHSDFSSGPSSLAHNKYVSSLLNSCLEQTGQFSPCDQAQEVLCSNNDLSESRSEQDLSLPALHWPQHCLSRLGIHSYAYPPHTLTRNVCRQRAATLLGSPTFSELSWVLPTEKLQKNDATFMVQMGTTTDSEDIQRKALGQALFSVLQRALPSAVRTWPMLCNLAWTSGNAPRGQCHWQHRCSYNLVE